jgi:signal transduction histidine kinase
MSKKLLYKTEQIYLIFSIVTFIIVAPLFYFISEKLYLDNADESLILRKYLFTHNSLPILKESDIPIWNKFNPDIKILPDKGIKKDTLFFTSYFEDLDKEYESFRELNAPIFIDHKPYTFSARINMLASYNLMLSIALLFIILLLFLLIGLYFINKRFSYSLWKPFYKTLDQIEHYKIDKNKEPRFENSDIEEFQRLNKSLKKLIRKNAAIYKNQHEFIENAAHELQTPIAVFKGKLDILMQRSDITKGQSELLESLNNSISALGKLNKNLLFLSKIDKPSFEEISKVSVKKVIQQQLDFFTEQSLKKDIQIHTKLENDVIVNANKGLVEVLISNLFLNAIQHNIPQGKIIILLSEDGLNISNTGNLTAIKPEDLFNRFSKSGSSVKGNGLGLAIVKKITDLYHWNISYIYSNETHLFSVIF